MTGTLTRRAALSAVPAAAVVVPYRDHGADDPLLEVEAALREAEQAAQRLYEMDGGAAYEAAAELEDALRDQLATAPATTAAGGAAKLRLALAEMDISGCGGPAFNAVKTTLDYLTQEAGR